MSISQDLQNFFLKKMRVFKSAWIKAGKPKEVLLETDDDWTYLEMIAVGLCQALNRQKFFPIDGKIFLAAKKVMICYDRCAKLWFPTSWHLQERYSPIKI